MNESLLFLIPLMPLLCGVLNTLVGMRLPRLLSEALAIFGVLFAAADHQRRLHTVRRVLQTLSRGRDNVGGRAGPYRPG